MFRESLVNSTTIGGATPQPFSGRGETVVNNVEHGDTFHFHGDINIGDKQTAQDFFDEVDRRSGRRTQLARRGMVPAGDQRLW
jgi:hypothetical protein